MAIINVEIDKLTNSVENRVSGEIFHTSVVKVSRKELLRLDKNEWNFDWAKEASNGACEVFKITTVDNENVIHGLISLIDKRDHIYMSLIESAKFNKGKNKLYLGVAGNLVAFACKMSFSKGYDGVVSFIAKTQLIKHYEISLGAQRFGTSNRMYIDSKESLALVKQYFNK